MTERTRTAARILSDAAYAAKVRADTYATTPDEDGLIESFTEGKLTELEEAIATFRHALAAEREVRR